MKVPDINAPLEQVEFESWVKATLLKLLERDEDHDGAISSIMKKLGMAAGSSTRTNVQVAENTREIIELKDRAGLPPGGEPGDTITRPEDRVAVWTNVPYAVVPEYWVTLEEGAPSFTVNRMLDDENLPLPPVLFIDGGLGMEPIESRDSQAPINLSVEVVPHADDDEFTVSLPLVGGTGGGSPSYFTLALYNSSAFRARVELGKQGLFSGGSMLLYHGTQTPVYTPGEDMVRVLEPGEFVNWWVQLGGQDSFTGWVSPMPVKDYVGSSAIGYADAFYTKQVASMRHHETWSARGTLEVATDDLPVPNGTSEVMVLGKVVVQLGDASAGADVQVDVKRNGVSIFTSPLVVTAGATTGSKVPDVNTHTASGVGVPGFAPGDRLTVDIVQVGSPGTEGTGMCVLVYFG